MKDSEISANKYRYFAVAALGTFMATLDGSIVNVALPTIARELNASLALVSWVVLSYTLTLISLMLIFGALIQRKGYAFGYKFGFVFFLLGSIACSLADNIYLLIGARMLQAIGTAMFAAIGPGLVTTVFPPEERGKGIGLMVMMVSLGFMSGPPIGGFLLGIWTWHSIFLINIPIGLFGLFYVFKQFGDIKVAETIAHRKFRGAIALSVSLVSFVFLLKVLINYSFSDPYVLGLMALMIVALILFVRIESDPATALIGFEVFRNREFSLAIIASQLHFIALSGVLLLGPFYLEIVQGLKPQQVAWYLVTLAVAMLLISPLSGLLSDKVGARLPTTLGMLIMASGLYMFSSFGIDTSNTIVFVSLALAGIGVGAFSSPNSSALMGSVSEKHRSVTSSILATNRNIGHAVGVAVATSLFAYFKSEVGEGMDERLAFIESFRPVFYVAIGFSLLGAVVCVTRSNKIFKSSLGRSNNKGDSKESSAELVEAGNKSIDSGR